MKPTTEENPVFITGGIVLVYILIIGFIGYFYFLHRISFSCCTILFTIFTLVYIPRFFIIKELFFDKDEIKITDNSIIINGTRYDLFEIKNSEMEIYKPKVIFFINNKMIIYQKAKVTFIFPNKRVSIQIYGSEKIKLLKQYLDNLIS